MRIKRRLKKLNPKFLFLGLLLGLCTWAAAQEAANTQKEPSCQRTCKKEDLTYVFEAKFCCHYQQQNTQLFCQNIEGEWNGEKCVQSLEDIDLLSTPKNNPFNPAREIQEKYMFWKQKYPNHAYYFHTCTAKDMQILLTVAPNYMTDIFLSTPLYQGYVSLYGETMSLPTDEDARQSFFYYLCEMFNPQVFFETRQAPPWSRPRRKTDTGTAQKENTLTEASRSKDAEPAVTTQPADTTEPATATQPADTTEPATANQPAVANKPTAANKLPAAPRARASASAKPRRPYKQPAVLSSPNGWHILNTWFYPANVPGNLKNIRRFENADKTAELKIQFSSGDKTRFVQRLQSQLTTEPRVTSCPNNATLFETAQNGLYQAFIIRQDGIAVLTFGYAPEQGAPFLAPPQRDELCGLDINRAY